MARKYSEQEVINELSSFLKENDICKLYRANFIKRIGASKSGKPYSEQIAEFLLGRMDLFKKDLTITRNSTYCVPRADSFSSRTNFSGLSERLIAKELYGRTFDSLGKIINFEVPLKNSNEDIEVGDIDMVSVKDEAGPCYLIELKKPKSNESLISPVLEIATYYRQLNHYNFRKDFHLTGRDICCCILVGAQSKQAEAYEQLKEKKNSSLMKLIRELEVEVFFYSDGEKLRVYKA